MIHPKLAQNSSHSTDDQVFEDNIPGQIEIVDLKGTGVEKPFITLENIFANKWIPYQTTIHTFWNKYFTRIVYVLQSLLRLTPLQVANNSAILLTPSLAG